jgi:hypothetical protein
MKDIPEHIEVFHNREHLAFTQVGGALLFHLLSKLYEPTSVILRAVTVSDS